ATMPAIALTGFGMKRDTEAALAAGYNAHLCKPVDAKQLSAVIEQLAAKQLYLKISDFGLKKNPKPPIRNRKSNEGQRFAPCLQNHQILLRGASAKGRFVR